MGRIIPLMLAGPILLVGAAPPRTRAGPARIPWSTSASTSAASAPGAGAAAAGADAAASRGPVVAPATGGARVLRGYRARLSANAYPLAGPLRAELDQLAARVGAGEPAEIVTYFRPPHRGWIEPGRDERVRVAMARLLEAAVRGRPGLRLRVDDPDSPRARRAGVRENGEVHLRWGDRRQRLFASDLERTTRRPGPPDHRGRATVTQETLFYGQQELASGLARLGDAGTPCVCLWAPGGVAAETARWRDVVTALDGAGFRVRRLAAELGAAVDEGCLVTALFGAADRRSPALLARLRARIAGGRATFLEVAGAGDLRELGGLLGPLGIDLPENRLSPAGGLRPQVNGHYVTDPLLGQGLVPGAAAGRAIDYSPWAQRGADVRTLLQSVRGAGDLPVTYPLRSAERLVGPLSFAVAISSRPGSNDGLFRRLPGELRLGISGIDLTQPDLPAATARANREFLVWMARWLAREPAGVAIPGRPIAELLR